MLIGHWWLCPSIQSFVLNMYDLVSILLDSDPEVYLIYLIVELVSQLAE